MNLNHFPKQSLGFFPTPLVELPRLSEALGGPHLFIKRDDQTGLAFGGNKTRKLEYLVGEAIAQGYDTLITGGAEQSNHCRQTAAAAAAAGLSCHLVLGGEPPDVPNGNILLDQLFGAEIHWNGKFRKGEKIPEIAEEIKRNGGKPYIIPYGASNATGALGFVAAVRELDVQMSEKGLEFSHVVFPSSSGGTQAGLICGSHLFSHKYQLIGIGIDKGETGGPPFEEQVLKLTNETSERLKLRLEFSSADIIICSDYWEEGYGVVGELERNAIRMVAEKEGILLDPVYTGRAMGALIDMVQKGEFLPEEQILFWHTGGTPALFPYAPDLL